MKTLKAHQILAKKSNWCRGSFANQIYNPKPMKVHLDHKDGPPCGIDKLNIESKVPLEARKDLKLVTCKKCRSSKLFKQIITNLKQFSRMIGD